MAQDSKSSGQTAGLSVIEKIRSFAKGVRAEYQKIIFPSQDDLRKETVAAIAVSIAIGLIIFVFDSVFKSLLGLIL